MARLRRFQYCHSERSRESCRASVPDATPGVSQKRPTNVSLGSLDMTHQRNSKGHAFSPDDRTQSVDFEFRSRLHQRCVCDEMLCEFRIVIQPPESIGGENNVCGAASAQLFKVNNRFLVIARNTS